jgi:ribosomal protein S18 acetylase RimI-like enzyme
MYDLKPYSTDDSNNWLINSDKTVLIRVGIASIMKSWGIGLLAEEANFQDILLLQNIYVKPECRGQGLFKEYMDKLDYYVAMRNKAFILFPTPFEFDKDPFEYGKNARVIESRDIAKKERLIGWYKNYGLEPVKTAYYGRRAIIGGLVNTSISGEEKPRKAEKGEYFAKMTIPSNFGYQYLGVSYGVSYPLGLFYKSEIHPDFIVNS